MIFAEMSSQQVATNKWLLENTISHPLLSKMQNIQDSSNTTSTLLLPPPPTTQSMMNFLTCASSVQDVKCLGEHNCVEHSFAEHSFAEDRCAEDRCAENTFCESCKHEVGNLSWNKGMATKGIKAEPVWQYIIDNSCSACTKRFQVTLHFG